MSFFGPPLDEDPPEQTYKIVRYFEDSRGAQLMQRGLTLAEAKAHCSRSDTHGPGWFDGFTAE